ncbi:BlaI/MecI/CopY family transcriptional regulator [Simiduia sp. 21SJ11W-1]|uniref:BlaI/MecI/CopY family transcriptional regulator n=1 Tax=Simiduia sp. 21SJ11W-1 TaxID=2909669 RepID=UPI00209F2CE7|nr:BlaI/MecI/CopY family transcriptional regulator [Simiduia sp. 21SJ11W-1]UTA48245.1 BlaI/MecI/CopY family transcriptional regulator [Simiduia sp. 21SJ11W-1]
MTKPKISRREREILDVLYQAEEASAQQVQALMPDPPSYSSVRALLARMIEKGLVNHRQEGTKYVYRPAQAREQAQHSALTRMLKTFFDGSIAKATQALLGERGDQLSDAELDALEQAINKARAKKRAQ